MLKKLLLFLGSVVFLFVLAMIILLSSASLQTPLIRSMIPVDEGAEKALESGKFGFGGLSLKGFRTTVDGAVFDFPEILVDISVWQLLGGNFQLNKLAVRGEVDLRNQKTAVREHREHTITTDPGAEPDWHDQDFTGLLGHPWPQNNKIGEIDVDLKVRITEDRTVELTVTGGNFQTGADGKVTAVVRYQDTGEPEGSRTLQELEVTAELGLSIGEHGAMDNLIKELQANLRFAEGEALAFALENRVTTTPDGEAYYTGIRSTAPHQITLWESEGTFVRATRTASFSGNADFQLSQVLAGTGLETLPEANVKARKLLQINPALTVFQFESEATVSAWERMNETLADLEPLYLALKIDGNTDQEVARLRSASVRASYGQNPESIAPFLLVDLPSEVVYQIEKQTPEIDPNKAILEIQLGDLPVSVLQAFSEDLTASLGSSRAHMQVFFRDNQFILETLEALQVSGLSLSDTEGPILSNLSLSLTPSLTATPSEGDKWEIAGGHQLNVTSGEQEILRDQATYTGRRVGEVVEHLAYTSEATVNLGGLFGQPLFRDGPQPSSGTLTSNLQMEMPNPEAIQLSLNGKLENLPALEDGTTPPELNFAMTLAGDVLDQMNLNGSAELAGNGKAQKITLESGIRAFPVIQSTTEIHSAHIDVAPWLGIAQAFQPKEPAEKEPDATPDERPVWDGMAGTLNLRVDEMHMQEKLVGTELLAQLKWGGNEASLETLSARLRDGSMNGNATLQFRETEAALPYHLEGSLVLQNLQVGDYIADLMQEQIPLLSGLLGMNVTYSADTPNLSVLADHLTLESRVSARTGVLRALADRGGQSSGGLTRLLRQTGGLGALIGGDVGDITRSVEVVTSVLEELHFGDLAFTVHRSPERGIRIRQLQLMGEQISLSGEGAIQPAEGTPFWQSPMALNLNLAAKGQLGEALEKLGISTPVPDGTPGDFTSALRPFDLTGTLANPDSDSVWKLLLDGVRGKIGGGGAGGLLGR